MKYSKKIVLKNNKECLLRIAVASDAQQVYDIFNLTQKLKYGQKLLLKVNYIPFLCTLIIKHSE